MVCYENLQVQDRRRIVFKERLSSTAACLTTASMGPTMVPQQLSTGTVAHLLGAIDPVLHAAVGGRIDLEIADLIGRGATAQNPE